MELLESLKSSLEKQSIEQGNTLYSSSNRSYINNSLTWRRTIEGCLFWSILHYSYRAHGIYDYVTLVKLYHVFGRDAFYHRFSTLPYYRDYFDIDRNCLSDEGFEKLCKSLERNGAIRRD